MGVVRCRELGGRNMADLMYRARVKDNLLIELPAQAEALNLQPGDEIDVRLHIEEKNGDMQPGDSSDEKEQTRFRLLAERLFAQADAAIREPEERPDADKSPIAEAILEKH